MITTRVLMMFLYFMGWFYMIWMKDAPAAIFLVLAAIFLTLIDKNY